MSKQTDDAYVAALRRERAMYAASHQTARVKMVDAELRRVGGAPDDDVDDDVEAAVETAPEKAVKARPRKR
jgi:hypothetical protein